MTDQTPAKFQLKGITFPKLDFLFLSPVIGNNFDYSFRVEGLISDEKNIRLLFGVRLCSKEQVENKTPNTPKIQITVEAIGDFEFEINLPEIKSINDVPLAGNLLALMYPFIREKIHYCFANNGLSLFLPPVNTLQIVKENYQNPNFKITDARSKNMPLADAPSKP